MKMTCPIDGCDYTAVKETEEQTRNSLIAHMSGKKDDGHKGLGYRTAPQVIDADKAFNGDESDGEPEPEPDPDPEPEPQQQASETPEATADGGGENPAFGGPEPDTSKATDGGSDSTEDGNGDVHPCPNPECDEQHDISGLSPGKYNCAECGRVMRVTNE